VVDIQDLVALATKSRHEIEPVCWFEIQDDEDTINYLAILNAIEHENPGRINRQQVMRTLNGELGHDISRWLVQRHFRRECTCER